MARARLEAPAWCKMGHQEPWATKASWCPPRPPQSSGSAGSEPWSQAKVPEAEHREGTEPPLRSSGGGCGRGKLIKEPQGPWEPGPWLLRSGAGPAEPEGQAFSSTSWSDPWGCCGSRAVPRAGTSLESGWLMLTRQHSPMGLSMEGRSWLGGYQQPQVWYVMSQVHPGNPTRRHNYRGGPRPVQRQVRVHQSPAELQWGSQAEDVGDPSWGQSGKLRPVSA